MSAPLFNWLDRRTVGVFLHLSSLPGNYGIGTMGKSARGFIDFLSNAGVEYWQVCPLGPTGYGDSPYQSFSSFAGSSYFIDIGKLVELEVLTHDEVGPLRQLSHERVDYGGLFSVHRDIMFKAYERFTKDKVIRKRIEELYGSFEKFKSEKGWWLERYCAFRAFKKYFEGKPWYEWGGEYGSFKKASKTKLFEELKDRIEAHAFYQYLFYKQWYQLREYADSKGVKFIGDVPIFVAMDSSIVWSRPELFQVGRNGMPNQLAGVPPDYFSETGQYWGNPLYKWENHKKSAYEWWIQRLANNYLLFDVLRLDHFRGFESYWSIPTGSPDATHGKWKAGPGMDFFKAIKEAIPEAKMIAEDLGMITDEVRELLGKTGLPGMAVFQFAFDGDAKNTFLPHNLVHNQVLYTGTHDNDTTLGWYHSLNDEGKDEVRRYLRVPGHDVAWDLIHKAYESVSNLIVIPVTDLLNKGSEARLNYPGHAEGNWQWRMNHDELYHLHENIARYLKELKGLYGR